MAFVQSFKIKDLNRQITIDVVYLIKPQDCVEKNINLGFLNQTISQLKFICCLFVHSRSENGSSIDSPPSVLLSIPNKLPPEKRPKAPMIILTFNSIYSTWNAALNSSNPPFS